MTNIISFLQTGNWSEALGWTLIHSLWQSGIIALLLGFAFIALHQKSAHVRYLTASGAFIAVFGAAFTTFFALLEFHEVASAPSSAVVPIYVFAEVENISKDSITAFEEYFSEHLPFIVSFWYVGVTFLMLRFLAAYAYTKRLKTYRVTPALPRIEDTAKQIAHDLGLTSQVYVAESPLIDMPMVLGALKPVILLPIGMMNGLSVKETESILAHEIAHIKRHDYLINLLQSFGEILLFFNPFVWWISSLIRKERENCCDDIAVAYTGDRLTYAKSLAAVEELRQVRLAVAFGGQKKTLLQRVKRIIEVPRKEASFADGILTSFFMLGFILLISFSAEARLDLPKPAVEDFMPKNSLNESEEASITKVENKIKTAFQAQKTDTIYFGKGYKVITHKSGKTEIYHNDKLISPEEYVAHKEAFEVKKRTSSEKDFFHGFGTFHFDTVNLAQIEDFKFDFKSDEGSVFLDLKNKSKIWELHAKEAEKIAFKADSIAKMAEKTAKNTEELVLQFSNGQKGVMFKIEENDEKVFIKMDSLKDFFGKPRFELFLHDDKDEVHFNFDGFNSIFDRKSFEKKFDKGLKINELETLKARLREKNILEKNAKNFKLEIKDGVVKVNDRKLSDEEAKIVYDFIPKSEAGKVKIEINQKEK
jgi:beta-lactamase regulating signal transducer with metallopeptidase domain